MNIHDIKAKLDTGIWSVLPERHNALKASINAFVSGDMDMTYVTSASMDDEFTDGTTVVFNVSGVLVKCGGCIPDELASALGICDIDDLYDDVKDASTDPSISTIVFNFDSGGGETQGIYELGQLIAKVGQSKDVIGYTAGSCYSAAYWLAAKCNELYCSPSSGLGSIGVKAERLDLTKANDEAGIKITPFASSPKKFWFDPDYAMSDEEAQYIKAEVDNQYSIFKAEVLSNRDIDASLMDAQCFDGITATKNNFADGIFNSLDNLLENLSVSAS